MIDYHKNLIAALNKILPTHYELTVSKDTATPCITYIESNNAVAAQGGSQGYSWLGYTIKVWGNDIGILQGYALQIDEALRALGWERTSSRELYDINSTMIQKIMNYEALGFEKFN